MSLNIINHGSKNEYLTEGQFIFEQEPFTQIFNQPYFDQIGSAFKVNGKSYKDIPDRKDSNIIYLCTIKIALGLAKIQHNNTSYFKYFEEDKSKASTVLSLMWYKIHSKITPYFISEDEARKICTNIMGTLGFLPLLYIADLIEVNGNILDKYGRIKKNNYIETYEKWRKSRPSVEPKES